MPIYKCTYRDSSGNLISDEQTAADQNTLIQNLRKKNFFPIKVEEVTSKKKRFFSIHIGAKQKEIEVFTRQLSNLLLAGLDLSKALTLLCEHTKHPRMHAMIAQIRDDVLNGGFLWEAVAKFPKHFPSLYISMVKAGEVGENLEQVMYNLADHVERQQNTKQTIISMMIYPVTLLLVSIAAVLFILTFVFPRMSFIFADMSSEKLPWITKFVMGLSQFCLSYGWIVAVFLVFAVIVVQRIFVNPALRLKLSEFFYRAPFLAETLQKSTFVRFARILSLTLQNGIAITDAIEIAKGVVANKYVEQEMEIVQKHIVEGSPLSTSLAMVDVFPPLAVHIIAIGEQTGELEDTLLKTALSYEREVQEKSKRWIQIMEPALIFLLAIMVAAVVSAILLPIFQIDLQVL